MKKKFPIATPQEFFKAKYELLSSIEISALMKTKENCSWGEWYEALQAYADSLGGDWERSLVSDCGEAYWREMYSDGLDTEKAFLKGFSE